MTSVAALRYCVVRVCGCQYYIKPNVKRRMNAKNTHYYKQRKEIVDEYTKLAMDGKFFTIPKTGF